MIRLNNIAWLLLLSTTLYAQQPVRQILILGDSHLNGEFGEQMHRKLAELKAFDVYSISIGGAGSKHFTLPLRNHCCGYKIRESCHDEVIPVKQKVRTIEKNIVGNNEMVAKMYNGQLNKVLEYIAPKLVLIALGNNYVNDHQNLVNIIRLQAPDAKIIWIGPVLRSNMEPRLKAIDKVVAQNNILFIRSDDLVGHDTITSTHFYGKTAQNWAGKIVERLSISVE